MAKISADEVRRLAALARISLTDKEVMNFQHELETILGYVEKLQHVDIKDIEPTDQVTGLVDVWRKDEVSHGEDRKELLKNAPAQHQGYLKVKRVL